MEEDQEACHSILFATVRHRGKDAPLKSRPEIMHSDMFSPGQLL